MPEKKDGYLLDDSILEKPITPEELIKYLDMLDEQEKELEKQKKDSNV